VEDCFKQQENILTSQPDDNNNPNQLVYFHLLPVLDEHQLSKSAFQAAGNGCNMVASLRSANKARVRLVTGSGGSGGGGSGSNGNTPSSSANELLVLGEQASFRACCQQSGDETASCSSDQTIETGRNSSGMDNMQTEV